MVREIERLLPREACIGSVDRWERHYRYAPLQGTRPLAPDRRYVDFDFIEAGFDGFMRFRSRRYIEPVDGGFLYDGGARVASGRYDIATGEVNVHYCGSNYPQTPEEKAQIERWLGNASTN